jgi:hypothetical protein
MDKVQKLSNSEPTFLFRLNNVRYSLKRKVKYADLIEPTHLLSILCTQCMHKEEAAFFTFHPFECYLPVHPSFIEF